MFLSIPPRQAAGTLRVGILKGSVRSLPLSRRPREFTSRRRYNPDKIPRGLPRGIFMQIVLSMPVTVVVFQHFSKHHYTFHR